MRKAKRPRVRRLKPRDTGEERLIDRAWVKLLAAAWVVAVVAIYYRLQAERLVQALGR